MSLKEVFILLDYCNTVSKGHYESHNKRLNKLLRRAARITFGRPYRTPSADVFKSFWFTHRHRATLKMYPCFQKFQWYGPVLHSGAFLINSPLIG